MDANYFFSFFMCKIKVNNFIFYYLFCYFILLFFIFINNQGKQHKVLKSSVQCYFYQVNNQLYHMNGMHVLTVKSAASGDRVHFTFIGDRNLSNHCLYSTLVKGSNFALLAQM